GFSTYAAAIAQPVYGSTIVNNSAVFDATYPTLRSPNIVSNIAAYFTEYPDATDIIIRVRASSTSVDSIIRFINSMPNDAVRPRLSLSLEDIARTVENLDITVGTPANRISATADNTYSNDVMDLSFTSNGAQAQINGVLCGNGSTALNILMPYIAGNDGDYSVRAVVKNANGTVKADETFNGLHFFVNNVYFDSRGGTAVSAVTSVANGGLIAEPTPPEKQYCEFVGWYKEPALMNPWEFDTDTVTGNITLYAKWYSASAEADGSKMITAPSLDAFTRADGSTDVRDGNYYKTSAAAFDDQTANPNIEKLLAGADNNGVYRETFLRYDLESVDIDAILNTKGLRKSNRVILSLYLAENLGGTNPKTISAYLIPSNKTYALNRNYPKKSVGTGSVNLMTPSNGFAAYDAFTEGITVREGLRNTPPAASITIEGNGDVGNYFDFDITDALKAYFTENPQAANFGLVLTNIVGNNYMVSFSSSRGENPPKLYLPPMLDYDPEIPVDQNGDAVTLANIGGATELVLRDLDNTVVTEPGAHAFAAFYAANGKLLTVLSIPAASWTVTDASVTLNLNASPSVQGAASAKLILLSAADTLMPIKPAYIIQ
ncbi:MAG: InlB B-repeat-containing protein, partial [Clostridiales bacterium]|nr:InlB B-repeat-containing protein [Clostridiales bacterium]